MDFLALLDTPLNLFDLLSSIGLIGLMVSINNEPQEKSEMFFSWSEPMHKMAHKISPHKCENRELKIKSDLKPYFEDDHLENLRPTSFRQGEDDAPMQGYDEEHANNLPKSKYFQEVLQAKRKHQVG